MVTVTCYFHLQFHSRHTDQYEPVLSHIHDMCPCSRGLILVKERLGCTSVYELIQDGMRILWLELVFTGVLVLHAVYYSGVQSCLVCGCFVDRSRHNPRCFTQYRGWYGCIYPVTRISHSYCTVPSTIYKVLFWLDIYEVTSLNPSLVSIIGGNHHITTTRTDAF
jgi:hypothetical protein